MEVKSVATYSIMIFAWYFSANDTTCLADFSEFLDKSVGQRIVRIKVNLLVYCFDPFQPRAGQ